MTAFVFVCMEEGGLIAGLLICKQNVIGAPKDMMKLAIPGLLYAIQNNLLFVGAANLDGAIFSATTQLKTPTTAVLSVLILGRSLSKVQWWSLFQLCLGVAVIQIPSASAGGADSKGNAMLGLAALSAACCTSGFAGVYLEKQLKKAGSIWLRNVQLALTGAPLALSMAFVVEGAKIKEAGLFQGFDGLVWGLVLLSAFGGMVIAAVLKYADNIAKCFGTAIAVVACTIISWTTGDLQAHPCIFLGISLAITASLMYGLGLPAWLSCRK